MFFYIYSRSSVQIVLPSVKIICPPPENVIETPGDMYLASTGDFSWP